ncbi:hypothetical protein [Salinimicrobium oceani]|uniref:Phospholipase D-like domain-containing protein n=1 Tax=Salinimicrobium oceani TaxID=2722702 RepID=A0ABX1D4Q1_9FLAO|nr:hypothetical protein [Salinimicrobium oceani]NJW54163.1 hypothetical protein [Salinimicrobium oceani]
MIYTSGRNLESSVLEFIDSSNEITLFTAYLKLEELKRLDFQKRIKRIIVRWEIKDLCLGVSDLALFQYCTENSIVLYRNTRLHLKAFWNNQDQVLFGSANVTNRGLGEVGEYNYELNGRIDEIDFSTIKYFNRVILDSEVVTSSLYEQILQRVESIGKVEEPEELYLPFKSVKGITEKFLLSDLPMSKSISILYETYSSPEKANAEDKLCAAHDLELYNIEEERLDQAKLEEQLKSKFNSHPFIIKLKTQIQRKGSMSYGGVVRWVQENTTTVPTPRSWELKKDLLVNILYEWICHFDSSFNWSRPNHSQVIYYYE